METKTEALNKQTSTSALLGGIFKASRVEDYLKAQEVSMRVPSLPEHLEALCGERNILRADVIRRSGLDRSFGFQIFQGTKNPSRDKVIQLAVGFGLDYEETQGLLRIARKSALYPRIKRDAALIYCINRRLSFTDTQALLSCMELAILGHKAQS